MKMIHLCLLAILCPALSVFPQQVPDQKPLKIGDPVPDFPLNTLFSPVSKIQLSDYRGKLVILDFWSSTCGGCINLFPHMDSLQRQFGDKLQILLVNRRSREARDDEPKIRKIIDKVNEWTGREIKLPVTADNPWLDQAFPNTWIPHEVWLDTNGVVLSVTHAEAVNASNISAYFNGNLPDMHQKYDLPDIGDEQRLFINGHGGSGDNFLARSILTPYTEGIGGGGARTSDGITTHWSMLNAPFTTMLADAYPEAMSVSDNRLELKGEKTKFYITPRTKPIPRELIFCYDLVVASATDAMLTNYLRQDLERAFGLKVRIVNREMTCWALGVGPGLRKSFTRNGEQLWELRDGAKRKFMQNQPVPAIVQVLDGWLSIPLIDETRLKTNIDMELPMDLQNEEAILQSLRQAGFTLRKVKRTLPVTVITMN